MNAVKTVGSPLTVETVVEDQQLVMEIDSGTSSSIISEEIYCKMFSGMPFKNVSTKLVSVTGDKLEIFGKIIVNVKLERGAKKKKNYNLELFVIRSRKQIFPLLGRSWLDVMFPKWRVITQNKSILGQCNIEVNKIEEAVYMIRSKYPSVLSEMPNQVINKYKAEITIKPNTKPIFHKAYTVPFKLRDKVNLELDRLVESGILEPIKFSEWASPIVIIPKQNDSIRICMDCNVTINKSIQTEHYPLSNIEDLFASMANSAVFCVIDLSGAYQQLKYRKVRKSI